MPTARRSPGLVAPPQRGGGVGSTARRERGFTLLELIIVISVIAILASIAVPRVHAALETVRRTKVIQDIKHIAYEIDLYKQMYGVLPLELPDKRLDPWGNPYQYLNFSTVKGTGQMRKNKFLVPINTDYDLYSMGPDGVSVAPLTAKASRDDIIRANDGQFFGPASEY